MNCCTAISSSLGLNCSRVVTISWKLFVAGVSGVRRSLNNVYVLPPIKLNKAGTGWSSSMLFAKKTCITHPHRFPISLEFIYLPDSGHIFDVFSTSSSSSPLSCIRFNARDLQGKRVNPPCRP